MKKSILPALLLAALAACQNQKDAPDATGVFEATEVIVPAEAAGILRQFSITEGQKVEAGQPVGSIDCTQLNLQLDQVAASERALDFKKTDARPQAQVIDTQIPVQEAQIAAQNQQLATIEVEQARVQRLVEAKAATPKQLDDVNGQVAFLKKQIAAATAQLAVLRQQSRSQFEAADVANRGILSEKQPLAARKAQLRDQIDRCKIVNPVRGTVLSKYVEQFEMAAPGKPLYKVANLDRLTLRAYFTGDQLAALKIGQTVSVEISQGGEAAKAYAGTVNWISDKAEFTPKSIQTRDERANLVYAVRIEVANDGLLKIGMFGDVNLSAK